MPATRREPSTASAERFLAARRERVASIQARTARLRVAQAARAESQRRAAIATDELLAAYEEQVARRARRTTWISETRTERDHMVALLLSHLTRFAQPASVLHALMIVEYPLMSERWIYRRLRELTQAGVVERAECPAIHDYAPGWRLRSGAGIHSE